MKTKKVFPNVCMYAYMYIHKFAQFFGFILGVIKQNPGSHN